MREKKRNSHDFKISDSLKISDFQTFSIRIFKWVESLYSADCLKKSPSIIIIIAKRQDYDKAIQLAEELCKKLDIEKKYKGQKTITIK